MWCFNKETEHELLERAKARVSCQVDRCKPVSDNVRSNSCNRVAYVMRLYDAWRHHSPFNVCKLMMPLGVLCI